MWMEKLKTSKKYSTIYDENKIFKLNIFMTICGFIATLIIVMLLSYSALGKALPIYENLGQLLNGIISHKMMKEPIISNFFQDEGGISVSFIFTCICCFSLLFGLITTAFFRYKKLGILALSFTVIFILANLIFVPTGLSNKVDEFTDSKINLIENYLENKTYHKKPPICEGDFTLKSGLETSEEPVLKVKMTIPNTYYLKGYVGEKYNGKGWENLKPEELIKHNELFSTLHEKGFDGRCALAQGLLCCSGDESKNNYVKAINNITVENVGCNSKYFYTPYENIGLKGGYKDYIGDSSYISEGKSNALKYTFNATPYKIDEISSIKKSLIKSQGENKTKDFLKKEYNYRKFCIDNYTTLPNETEKNIREFLKKINTPLSSEKINSSEAKKILLKGTEDFIYDENIVYDLENGDFVRDFLKKKRGYSIHFATLGAAVFRYYGIPARFVEGFLITENKFKGHKSKGNIEINSSDYHSWMEYYEDGLGWVPFEVTPEYMGVMKSDNLIDFRETPKEVHDTKKVNEVNQKQNKINTKESEINKWASFVLILAILILVLLLFKFFKKLKKTRLKARMFKRGDINSPDHKKAILAMMYSINRLSKKRKLDHELMLEAKAIYQEAKYSNHEINKEKRDKMKKCYELLKKTATTIIGLVLIISMTSCSINEKNLTSAEAKSINFLMEKIQGTEGLSYGNEWIAMDLALSNENVPEKVFTDYLANLNKEVKAREGVLNTRTGYKYTEYSRVIIGVNAVRKRTGKGNPEDISGYNFLKKLCNIENVARQGINGVIWALIAFDSCKSEIPAVEEERLQTTRQNLVTRILDAQLEDGGWTVTGEMSDVDMTAMAIESLAPYYTKLPKDEILWNDISEQLQEDVVIAVNKGIELLSKKQLEDGNYESWKTVNSESASQVITALSSIGIDVTEDERFIKRGKNILDVLLEFLNSDGSFSHKKGDGGDFMATEQGLYSIIAYRRFKDEGSRLLEMT